MSVQFWVLVAFLVLVFLTGGGSRADIQSLLVLRPAAVLACGIGFCTLSSRHVASYRLLFILVAAAFILVVIHLAPLPPYIWKSLPGHDIVADADRLAGLGDVWRPLSMLPSGTWNAFYSLFIPLAVLVLGVQLGRKEQYSLLLLFVVAGLLSGGIGLLQVLGAPDGPLYLYRITNNGSAVGLFSNRNHQAFYLACLFPMLAVYASTGVQTVEQGRFRLWISIAAGVVLVPLLLVAGSRAGLAAGALGLASIPALYSKPRFDRPEKRTVRRFNPNYLYTGIGVFALSLLTILLARAQAFERLVAPDQANDLRFSVWGPIFEMAWKYFPFGSGIGSFVEVYQIDEPLNLLTPAYLNRAHNDWLEVWLTAGVPGALLLLSSVLGIAFSSYSAWRRMERQRRSTLFARLGSILLGLAMLASISDYPVRVPSIMSLLVVALLWLRGGSIPASGAANVPNKDGTANNTPLADQKRF